MDDDQERDSTDEDGDFNMPHASNAPIRNRDGPGSASPPPQLGFGGPPLPGMSPNPRMRFGLGYVSGGHNMTGPKARARQLLRTCGMNREVIKKIPEELLLTMTLQKCGLCCVEFHSFPLSRIHYMSKAHANSIKMWISHKSNHKGPKKEAPFRARELYCELCDVQITSKVHGDSHYAGKPHHAVVLGRKLPKNPMLLTPDAKERLEQLIRREKKALAKKPGGDGEDGAERAENSRAKSALAAVPKKEVKPFNPEHYCHICKTAVTCEDQMMMHMNGKKHLAKEKQHILKIMSGEKEVEAADNGDGGAMEQTKGAMKLRNKEIKIESSPGKKDRIKIEKMDHKP